MTIPRHLGPPTGPREVLPDYNRSDATVQRTIRALDGPYAAQGSKGSVLVIKNPQAGTLIAWRVIGALIVVAMILLMWALVGLGLWLIPTSSSGVSVQQFSTIAFVGFFTVLMGVTVLLSIHSVLTATSSRIELGEEYVRVVRAFSSRDVLWKDVAAVKDAHVDFLLHGPTSALILRDGSTVVLTALNRFHYLPLSSLPRAELDAIHDHYRCATGQVSVKGEPWKR